MILILALKGREKVQNLSLGVTKYVHFSGGPSGRTSLKPYVRCGDAPKGSSEAPFLRVTDRQKPDPSLGYSPTNSLRQKPQIVIGIAAVPIL